jgi:hypothetical protein
MPKAKLERGISRLPEVNDGSGRIRVPAILIRSTPWKAGTPRTPWHDSFDTVSSTVNYYGDNKIDEATGGPKEDDPGQVLGNKAMLEAHFAHAANDASTRRSAAPILLFTGIPYDGRSKGQVRFDGLGVVTGARVVRQEDETSGIPFANMLFEIRLLDLSEDHDAIDWSWVSERRRPAATSDNTAVAPTSWTRWWQQDARVLDEVTLRAWRVTPLTGT